MGKNLVSRTAKVLSETKRSKDKEAVAISYEHIPRNPREQEHGSVYAVIELEDAGGHAEEIAEQVLDVFHNEYYADTDKTPVESFESSLAKINEALAERSSEGQIHWMGKLNAVLAVLADGVLHVTQAGKAEAYLYRAGHATPVTEDLAGDAVNPLRTFGEFASGELTKNDRVAFVTPGIFFKLSKNELQKYITEKSPLLAAENLSRIISGENGSAKPDAVLILEMVSPEELAISTADHQAPEAEIWVTPETKPLEVNDKTLKGATKVFDYLGKAVGTASAFMVTRAIPSIKKGAKGLLDSARGFRKESVPENIIIDSEERISHNNHEESESLETDDGILTTTAPEASLEREIRIKESDLKPKRLSLERFDFSIFSNAKDGLAGVGKKIRLPRGKSSIIYIIIAVLIGGSLLGYFLYTGNSNKSKTAAENIYAQAKSKYETALTEIESGNRAGAIETLETAESLANDAKKTTFKKSDAEKLLADITVAKDGALGIKRNTATQIGELAGAADNLFSDGKILYAVSYENGTVYSFDTATNKTTTLVEGSGINGRIKFANFVTKRKTIVAYTEAKEIYEIDLVAKKITKQTVSGTLEDAVAISSYNSNVYLLSPADNQIYKHVSNATGYGAKSKYLVTPESGEVANGVALSIDSDVYVISNDGFIKKYTTGKRQDYNLNNLPENITNPTAIFVDPNVLGQYVITKDNRIIRIDDKQTFSAQYVSDGVTDIKGIYVNDTAQTIYALSQGKIYSIKY